MPPGVVRTRPVTQADYALIVDAQGRPIRVERETDRPFSPMPPGKAELPERTPPRALIPPLSANLQRTPRTGWPQAMTAFDLLRALSDDGLVRIAMNDVRGQILGIPYQVTPLEGEKSSPALEKEAVRIREWMRMPDRLNGVRFRRFMSKALEEMLTTDALSICPRFTVGGEFLGLEQIDGATILPLVDGRGQAPLVPEFAYEQIVDGRLETQFSKADLWYMPANPRTNNPYDRSPVEMVLMFINLALRAQMFDLSWFTEGNIPEGLFSCPEEWTPDMIATYQKGFNDETAGADGKRAGLLRFVPPGAYHELKSHKFELDFYEFVARAICFAFGVSPMPLVKMMNRGTGETLELSTAESGVRPVAMHLAEVLTEAVQGPLNAPMLQVVPASGETEDAAVAYQRNVAYFSKAGLTLDEWLEATGSDKIGGDLGNERFWETAAGPVSLTEILEQRKAKIEAARNPQPAPPANQIQPGQETTEPQPGDPSQGKARAEAGDAAEKDLARWQTFAVKRLKDGRPLRKFDSAVIPYSVRVRIEHGLERAAGYGDDHPHAAALVKTIFELGKKGRTVEIEPAALVAPRLAIEAAIKGWLTKNQGRIISDVLSRYEPPAEKLRKDDARRVPKLDDLDLDMSSLEADLEAGILAAAKAGASDAAPRVGVALGEVPESSLAYARARAADLVGMEWNDAGELVENPRAKFVISDTLRADIKSKVAQAVEKGWSPQTLTHELTSTLGPARAQTVARTECLPGGTLVDAAVVVAAHRRWYEGPMVEIVTAHGRKLSATPNHPMLTGRGWVGAGEITLSDDLICDGWQQHTGSPSDVDIEQRPSTISEVFDSLAAVGVMERRDGAEPDFHGDGRHGDIYVAEAHGALPLGTFTPLYKPSVDLVLSEADEARARFCGRCQRLLPSEKRRCICSGADVDAGIGQSALDDAVRDAETTADRVNALACAVAGDDFRSVDVGAPLRGQAAALMECEPRRAERPGDSGSPDIIGHSVLSDASGPRRNRHAQPMDVEIDRVASVIIRPFAGHVFNLSTVDGYFAINGGVYTGNTGMAYNAGAVAIYEESGLEFVEILDGDGCLPVGHDEGSPLPSADEVGKVQDGAQANGQVWTIAQFQQHLLGHPRCVRSGIPYILAAAQAAA